MINPRILFWSTWVLLCFVIVGPALASTVQCPSTCSCILPSKAKELGFSRYCEDRQAICGYDETKHAMYCYEKVEKLVPMTQKPIKPIVTISGTPVIKIPTSPFPVQCLSGCICSRIEDAKVRGLSYCNGTQTLCGYGQDQNPLYCFTLPSRVTLGTPTAPSQKSPGPTPFPPVTPIGTPAAASDGSPTSTSTPLPTGMPGPVLTRGVTIKAPQIPDAVPCPSHCICVDEALIREKGYPLCGDSPTVCGYSKAEGVLYCAQFSDGSETRSAQQGSDIFSTTWDFMIWLVSGQSEAAPLETTLSVSGTDAYRSYWSYCWERYGMKSCGGYCVDLLTDPDHCGRCFYNCHGDTPYCVKGNCTTWDERCEQWGGTICYESWGTKYCANLTTGKRWGGSAPQDCGSCGNSCRISEVCDNGTCRDGNSYCEERFGLNYYYCSGECVDLSINPYHCGRCGNACSSEQFCINGTCIYHGGTGDCPEIYMCDGRCVDLMFDEDNCRECGAHCYDQAGWKCIHGTCTYDEDEYWAFFGYIDPNPQTATLLCDGLWVNPFTDANHCGMCGHQCPDDLPRCCSGLCVDLAYDSQNCGSCGESCPSWEPTCAEYKCYNFTTDEYNCGGIGDPWPLIRDPYYKGVTCKPGERCCDGRCVRLDDYSNCGSCGKACDFIHRDELCCAKVGQVGYECVPRANFSFDPRHCGSCDNDCTRTDQRNCCNGECCT